MIRRRPITLALTFGLLLTGLWVGAPAAHACHTALHCAQEEVEEQIAPFLRLVPEDTYSCVLLGRSSTWDYIPGAFPPAGAYRFEGEASCVRLDTDGTETGPRLTGSFVFSGEHSQLLGLPACTMFMDGVHVLPDDHGTFELDSDNRSPLSFRHLITVAGGQGYIDVRDDGDSANGAVAGYGAVDLVPSDVVETVPNTDPGCVTSQAQGFFIQAAVVVGIFPPPTGEAAS